MADTYEKDLGQKSSLTTSDFIRVVGSDNVSYKQKVSAVMTAMGLDAVKTPATSLSNIDTATATGFYSYSSGASGTKPLEGSGGDLIVISHNANYSVQVAIPYSPTNATGIYKRVIVSGTPSDWQLQPTRAEVNSLNNNWHKNLVVGQNLNDIDGRGFYDCPSSAIAQSLVNCPTTNNFVMQTLTKGAYCTQIIFTGDKMFLRTQVSSGWGSWYMFTATAV